MPSGFSVGSFAQRHLHLRVMKGHIFPVYASSEMSHAYPEIYPNGSCGCGDVSIGCCLLPGSVYQYLTPASGQPPTPTSEPPWPPRGLHCVGSLSLRTGSRIPFGSWAMGWPQQPPFALLQHGSTSSSLQVAPQGRQDVLDGLVHPFGPTGWQGRQPFE